MKRSCGILASIIMVGAMVGFGCSPSLPKLSSRGYRVVACGQRASIVGRVIYEKYYGPPGYGEDPTSDNKEVAYIVILDQPIRYISEGDASEMDVFQVQLLPTETSVSFSGRGTFSGVLMDGISGHRRRDVLLAVDRVVYENDSK